MVAVVVFNFSVMRCQPLRRALKVKEDSVVLILISVFVNLIFLATLLALQADLSAFFGC